MTGGRWRPGAALLASLLMLTACATAPRDEPGPPARPLAPPEAAGERLVSQVVRGAFGERTMTLRCVVSVKGGEMSVVGLNSVGVRLFTLAYDGRRTRLEQSVDIPDAIAPGRLLADLQLVYWPLASLRETLRGAGFEVSEPAAGARQLRRGDRLIAEVNYPDGDAWSGSARLVSHEFGYSLQIDSQPL